MDLTQELSEGGLALAGLAAHQRQRPRGGQKVLGSPTQLRRVGPCGEDPLGRPRHGYTHGLDIDEEIGKVMSVQLDLPKLHLGVLVPLRRDHLQQQATQLLILRIGRVGFDDVPHRVLTGEHLRVVPDQLPRGKLDTGVNVGPPPAVHIDAELLGVVLQYLVELVHRSRTTCASASDAGYQHIGLRALGDQALDVVLLPGDRGLQPRDRILDRFLRPLDLIDDLPLPGALAYGIATPVLLADREARDIGEGLRQQGVAQLLEPLLGQALVQVPLRGPAKMGQHRGTTTPGVRRRDASILPDRQRAVTQ